MRKAIILFVVLLVALPTLFSIHSLIPELSLEWISSIGNALIQTEYFIPNFEGIQLIMHNSLLILNTVSYTHLEETAGESFSRLIKVLPNSYTRKRLS